MTTRTTRIEDYGAELNVCHNTTCEIKETMGTIKDNLIDTSEIFRCKELIWYDDYTHTVYGYVPIEVVEKLIKKHGGIKT